MNFCWKPLKATPVVEIEVETELFSIIDMVLELWGGSQITFAILTTILSTKTDTPMSTSITIKPVLLI